jgi:hypothetical protein
VNTCVVFVGLFVWLTLCGDACLGVGVCVVSGRSFWVWCLLDRFCVYMCSVCVCVCVFMCSVS